MDRPPELPGQVHGMVTGSPSTRAVPMASALRRARMFAPTSLPVPLPAALPREVVPAAGELAQDQQ